MGEEGTEVQLNGHENGENDVIALKKALHHQENGIDHQEHEEHEGHEYTNGTASHEHGELVHDSEREDLIKPTNGEQEQEQHNEDVVEEKTILENGTHNKEEEYHEHHETIHHEVDESNHHQQQHTDTHTEEHQPNKSFERNHIESTENNDKHNTEVVEDTIVENGKDHEREEEVKEEEEEKEVEEKVEVVTTPIIHTQENSESNNVTTNHAENNHITTTTHNNTHYTEDKSTPTSIPHENEDSSHTTESHSEVTDSLPKSLDNSFVVIPKEEEEKEEEKEEEEEEEKKEEITRPEKEAETIVAQQGNVNTSAPRLTEDELLEQTLREAMRAPSSSTPTYTPPPVPIQEPVVISAAQRAQKLKDAGNAHFSAGRWDEAIDQYTQAIELDSEESVFYSNRSAAYLSKGDSRNALKDALEAIRLKPNWSKAYVRAGRAHIYQQNYVEAIAVLENGLRRDPSAPQKEITELINSCKENIRKRDSASSSTTSSGPQPSAGGLGTDYHKHPIEVEEEENQEGDSDDFDEFDESETLTATETKSASVKADKTETALALRSGKLLLWLTSLAGIGFALYRFVVKGK
eukprot:TRINITY_DN1736_c0_g1_i3.p1 TRINITY_DN1736_c0_g1~~TRINITY_DN1736_c0_g1_i3.p1  ORF type:complete len:579 (-),score=182.62 TRINITY_DN1736_c0_g1_i3:133-1869(-)